MTTKQRHLRKLNLAIRAFVGRKFKTFAGPVKWFRAPKKTAIVRIERWLHRCQARGYIHPKITAKDLLTQIK